MRILFLGDVMGRSGREGVKAHLPALQKDYAPDVVIVNAENASSGRGITMKQAGEFFALGVDCLTMGNHVWNQKELLQKIGEEPRIVRPLNYPKGTPGQGFCLHALPDGRKLLIVNVMGNLFMDNTLDDPFVAMDSLLDSHKLGESLSAIFVDFHAEATSEKMAFAHHVDGRVSAVIGTHTHIPTADAHVLRGGTAYQTDAGMCGDYDSVIGVKKERSLWRFTKKIPGERMEPAEGEATICGCFIETDDKTGRALLIEAFRLGGILSAAPETRR